ncbi:efflux RND transporter periplasmic adaptor subunit [Paenibacillus sp. GP183]|uniref:efflux RND transporter periplasmic adaptor subunit n=1 Tax=Paenibacillus sp. GP183 TaxID=1882751 RepID=UPI00089C9AB0|nr:efflux RND transporter periplasmic adaptor subunit [Paenibacillus sp. GP183]SEC28649.1 HlyD family secretion protein [Paenibacillus sp. GP183]
MAKKAKMISIAVAGLLLFGGGVTYYIEKPAAVAAQNIQLATVLRGDVSQTVSVSGTLAPANQVSFSSPGNGAKISAMNVKVGAKVQAGQVLATFDSTSAQIQLESAKANFASAQTKLSQAKKGSTSAQIAVQSANVEKAKANLNDAISNYDAAANDPKSTTSKKDQAKASKDQAQAAYDSAVEQLKSLKAGPDASSVQSAQASVDQAGSQVTQAQQTLDSYTIKAPFDGVVSAVNGQVGSPSANNAALLILDDASSAVLTATLQVSQTDITKIQSGMAAEVTTTALQGKTWKGTVTTVAPDSTTSNGLTTYAVGLNVENPDGLLRSGISINVTITTGTHSNVLYIPSMALKQTGNRTGVYIQDSAAGTNSNSSPSSSGNKQGNSSQNSSINGLKFVPIQTRYLTGSKVEVTSGLTEGEQIAIVMPTPSSNNNQKNSNGNSLFGNNMGGFGGGNGGNGGGGNRGSGGKGGN